MTICIAFVNLKGGVGKTTLAVNFAAYCGAKGYRTLLVDLDPQTNATFSCIEPEVWKEHSQEKGTVADILGARAHASGHETHRPVEEVLVHSVFPGVDLIPSHLDLFTIDLDLAGANARETKLRRALRDIQDDYEFIICDCPPNLTIPTQNALALANFYVVPINADYLSGIGISLLQTRVNEFADDLEKKIECAGIIISRYGRKSQHKEQIITTIREDFDSLLIDERITDRTAVAEAAANKETVLDSADAKARAEFTAVCNELYNRVTLGVPVHEIA